MQQLSGEAVTGSRVRAGLQPGPAREAMSHRLFDDSGCSVWLSQHAGYPQYPPGASARGTQGRANSRPPAHGGAGNSERNESLTLKWPNSHDMGRVRAARWLLNPCVGLPREGSQVAFLLDAKGSLRTGVHRMPRRGVDRLIYELQAERRRAGPGVNFTEFQSQPSNAERVSGSLVASRSSL